MVKGKRWKKGQSSSSNPTLRKYRDAAKANVFNFNTSNSKSLNKSIYLIKLILKILKILEKGGLTSEALAKLDSKSVKKIDIDDDDDNQSVLTADTFQSWASNWSDCTNATFNRVHKYWKSNSALHKEVLFKLNILR